MTDLEPLRAELALALGDEPANLEPLLGGAGRCELWTFRAAGRELVLRRYPEGYERTVVREREWDVLRLAHSGGVPVPRPVALSATGLIMERVDGEARPRRLLTGERWRAARAVLVEHVAAAAARLHALPVPNGLPAGPQFGTHEPPSAASPAEATLVGLERKLDRVGEAHPAIELGLRWLRARLPPRSPLVIVHGDFRMSNLIADADGLRAVVDWELVHAGDGAEDLGWMCIRSWRFGVDDRPALGCGQRDELLRAYAESGGRHVSPAELHWWEACGNARWAVICLLQADSALTGVAPSLERAMIGRRACEAEWDLLQMLAGDEPAPAPVAAPQDRPAAVELLALVADYLRDDLRPIVPREHAFRVLVAANACAVTARELGADLVPSDPEAPERARLLAAELRAGLHDDRLDELVGPLRAVARARLAVAHPGWDST